MAKDEPQSYGSQAEWVQGKVGETVNHQKETPDAQPGDSPGGELSDHQLADNAEPQGRAAVSAEQPVQKVTDQAGGAKRGGYFKNRDY